jgi:MFS family permease
MTNDEQRGRPNPTEHHSVSAISVLKIASIRRVSLVIFLSALASQALVVSLGLQVYDITRSKLDLGWLGLAEFVPALLLVLVTGSVADHFDRRHVAGVSFAGQTAVVGGLLWFSSTNPTSALPIFAMVVVWGVFVSFAGPAIRPLLPAAAPSPDLLPALSALSSISWQGAVILGPLLGAFSYKANPKYAFLLVIVLLAMSAFLTQTIKRDVGREHLSDEDDTPRPTFTSAIEGLSVVRRNPILFGAISLDLFAVLFGGAVALLPAIADERHWDKGSVGILRAAGGVGAALVTLVLAARPVTRNVGKVLLIAVGLFGAATIVFGLTSSIVVAILCMLTLNGADSVSVYVRSTLVPLVTPSDQRGRVLAVEGVFIGASNELGAFESGVAGQALGTAPAVVLGGVATLAIVALYWVKVKPLRDVDRFSDLSPQRSEEFPLASNASNAEVV